VSGLQERITEAIADYLDLSGVEDYPHLCPDAVNPVHMAAAVIAALGLREGYDPARDCLVIEYTIPAPQEPQTDTNGPERG
jgi:hypothetical protein